MHNDFVSNPVANRKTIGDIESLQRVRDVLNDDAIVSTAIFSGIGLFAALVAAISGVPGVWM